MFYSFKTKLKWKGFVGSFYFFFKFKKTQELFAPFFQELLPFAHLPAKKNLRERCSNIGTERGHSPSTYVQWVGVSLLFADWNHLPSPPCLPQILKFIGRQIHEKGCNFWKFSELATPCWFSGKPNETAIHSKVILQGILGYIVLQLSKGLN